MTMTTTLSYTLAAALSASLLTAEIGMSEEALTALLNKADSELTTIKTINCESILELANVSTGYALSVDQLIANGYLKPSFKTDCTATEEGTNHDAI